MSDSAQFDWYKYYEHAIKNIYNKCHKRAKRIFELLDELIN